MINNYICRIYIRYVQDTACVPGQTGDCGHGVPTEALGSAGGVIRCLVLSSAGILDRLVALLTGLEVRERERLVGMMREKHLRDGRDGL